MKITSLFPILFVMCLFGIGCKDVKDPEFRRVEKFRLKSLSLQPTVGFDVTYYNPNDFDVTVKDAEADIYLDTVYLGKFRQESSVSVRHEAEFSIPFSGDVPISTTLKLDLQNLPKRDILLKAEGSARIGKAGIYITKPIHYQGKYRLDEIKL